MNEKLIYEWLRHELKGQKGVGIVHEDGCVTAVWVTAYHVRHECPLPPLDMNTWHGEVVPKLVAEGRGVEFIANRTGERYWVIRKPTENGFSLFSLAAPYETLTEYLEAK
uniref:Uncharacterized protein n=1 Tax=viral metagenome TaxID=1070528 RepID=A0A6M3JFM6_9ZZZZ